MLQNQNAWTSLSKSQQQELLTYLPPETNLALQAAELADMNTEGEIPNIPLDRLKRSEKLKSDIRQFQEDLDNGCLDPAWLEHAENAARRRAAGEIDDWKAR